MKAKAQYNDLKGSVAADISDFYFNSLNNFLKEKYTSINWDQYNCVGCTFFASYGQYPSVRFVCRDVITDNYKVFNAVDLTVLDFFDLFKRFSIVLGLDGIDELEVDMNELTDIKQDNEL